MAAKPPQNNHHHHHHHSQKPHAIMIPYPYQGHITPFAYLAVKLASHGFTITFVNTRAVHYQITKAHTQNGKQQEEGEHNNIFTKARSESSGQLDIRYATVDDGFPVEFDRSLNHDEFQEGLLRDFSRHVDGLVGDLVRRRCDPPVTCLIADTFFVWTSTIASKYDLVNVSFWTEPALVLNLYYHLDLLKKNGHFASLCNREDTIDYIPGVEAIEPRDLMSYLRATDLYTVVHRIIYKAFEDAKNADIIICNTVQELEPNTISSMHKKQPTYAIGPIFPSGFANGRVATSLWSESDCTQWLNDKPNGSVLYVSFGSYAHTSKQDIVEIANGLLLSGVHFVWVLRPDIVSSDETNLLPGDLEKKLRESGVIVPWCSQIAVVSHPAIGGFLTHCGWNSILESIWCGVPLICFPLLTDQFTNRKLVVNDWKIGINLCDGVSVGRQEVAERVKRLMDGDVSNELRQGMKRVKQTLKNASAAEGSSESNFRRFVEDVKAKTYQKMKKDEQHQQHLNGT